MKKRIRIVQGGTAAGKTIGILQHLILLAILDKKPTLTSVVSESFPHLKRGAIRDFLSIMEAQGGFIPDRWNKTDYVFTFPNNSRIEFFSADQPGKVRGPRRDRLFINEANNISFETYEQLEVRTKEFVYLDYNPLQEFWVHTELLNKRNSEFLILTYKDNEALDETIIQSIEQRKDRPRWWKVYGKGEIGEAEGRIFTDWKIIDEIPHEARYEGAGLDFGYDPDPAAIVAVYYLNGGYILDEVIYGTHLTNLQLATALKNLPPGLTVADSAEPKSIDEIRSFKVNIVGTPKGQDSIRYGVKTLQAQRISVTSRSLNLIKEYRNFFQAIDRKTNIPIMGEYEGERHGLDAVRYKICSLIPVKRSREMRRALGEQQWKLNQQPTNPV